MNAGMIVCDDLIFSSRVTVTARAQGLTVTPVRSAEQAIRIAAESTPRCVLVDLHTTGLDLPALLADLRTACPAVPRVIGFGSHSDAERLKAARDAGCDTVLPRSKFVRELETKLPEWLT